MSDAPLPARRFTETDTDAILRRTAELASGGDATPANRGLTLDEMEALAREAGLSPALVRQAAREVSLREAQRRSPWLGAPRRIMLERELPGELTEDGWEVMVAEVQQTLGGMGYASKLGRTRSWSVGGRGPATSFRAVTISTRVLDGRTVLRIEESLDRQVHGLFGGLMGGLGGGGMGVWVGIGMGVFHSPLAAVGLALGALGGSYGLARTLYARAVAKRLGTLGALVERLATAGTALEP